MVAVEPGLDGVPVGWGSVVDADGDEAVPVGLRFGYLSMDEAVGGSGWPGKPSIQFGERQIGGVGGFVFDGLDGAEGGAVVVADGALGESETFAAGADDTGEEGEARCGFVCGCWGALLCHALKPSR